MNKPARYAVRACAVLAALAGAQWAAPDWLAELGLDTLDLPESLLRIESAEQTQGEMGRRQALVVERIAAKNRVTAELIGGRLTLLEAAARFRDLNDIPEDCPDPYRQAFSGDSDGEKLCRQVIAWVAAELRGRSSPLVECLEAELQDLLGRGAIELPD